MLHYAAILYLLADPSGGIYEKKKKTKGSPNRIWPADHANWPLKMTALPIFCRDGKAMYSGSGCDA